jgi:hypothetical protein
MKTLKLSYKEIVEEVEKLGLEVHTERRILTVIKEIYQKSSKELAIPSGAQDKPRKHLTLGEVHEQIIEGMKNAG